MTRNPEMDRHYYEILRSASQEDYHEAINSPDHELYDVLWQLFETVVIEPAEIFDGEFGKRNQFRYSINSAVTMEFFPASSYFDKRIEPNPYRDGSDAAGIHLTFSILPGMSCLFCVGFRIWGRPERLGFRRLWREQRPLLVDLFERAKPMVKKRIPFPAMDFAGSLEEMLDNYFAVRDSENFIELRYPFAQFDQTDHAQTFMVYMSLVYHSIRDYCQNHKSPSDHLAARMTDYFSGRLPDLPPPLPCVGLAITSDTE